MASETTLDKITSSENHHPNHQMKTFVLVLLYLGLNSSLKPFKPVHSARRVFVSDFTHRRALIVLGDMFISNHVISKVELCEFAPGDIAEGEKRGGEDWFVHEFEHRDE